MRERKRLSDLLNPDPQGGESNMDILGKQSGRPFEESRDPGLEVEVLVTRFANALRKKLLKSEEKYGWNNGWMKDGWNEDLNRDLRLHVEKGDPLDVAAYCAFAWHHEWSIAPEGATTQPTPIDWAASDDAHMDAQGGMVARPVPSAGRDELPLKDKNGRPDWSDENTE